MRRTSAALQPVLGAGAERGVHPMTGFAVLHADKSHALDLKFSADQQIQIHTGDKRIAPGGGGLDVG
ncbi:MAG: hypothetical protein NT154_17130 [Verrucomicrobia bacterium]|nr:hypothetical protein [Verrucomicrobiota bacterium]